MSDDDDENGEHLFNAPLPPHERSWVHPSEHAKLTENPSPARFDRSSARTLALFSILTCLAISVGVLAVTNPGPAGKKEPEMRATEAKRAPTPGVKPMVSPIAAAMTESGILITVIDGATVGQTVHVATPEATEFDAVVVDVEAELGVTLLKVVDDTTWQQRVTVTHFADESISPGAPIWVATPTFGVELSHISPSTSGFDGMHIPLEPFAASHHGGTVYTDDGTLIGWCIERDGRHWLVPAAAARSAVLRLDGDVPQP